MLAFSVRVLFDMPCGELLKDGHTTPLGKRQEDKEMALKMQKLQMAFGVQSFRSEQQNHTQFGPTRKKAVYH